MYHGEQHTPQVRDAERASSRPAPPPSYILSLGTYLLTVPTYLLTPCCFNLPGNRKIRLANIEGSRGFMALRVFGPLA